MKLSTGTSLWHLDNPQYCEMLRRFDVATLKEANQRRCQPFLKEHNGRKYGKLHFEPMTAAFQQLQQLGLEVRGKALIYPCNYGYPLWLAEYGKQPEVTDEECWEFCRQWILSSVAHHPKSVSSWDIVAECWLGGDWVKPRKCPWDKRGTLWWVPDAFRMAHAIAPDTQLFYADYRPKDVGKWERIVQWLVELRGQGMPVHGVNVFLQANAVPFMGYDQIAPVFELIREAGFILHSNESVAWNTSFTSKISPFPRPLAEPIQRSQYETYLRACQDFDCELFGVWYPWDGDCHHPTDEWQWNTDKRGHPTDRTPIRRVGARAGLWREDWSETPSYGVFKGLLREATSAQITPEAARPTGWQGF